MGDNLSNQSKILKNFPFAIFHLSFVIAGTHGAGNDK
jgi:hypothetical protein